jgi:homocitrate synthase NifV
MEIGIPAMGGSELETIREIVSLGLSARLVVWGRMCERDLQASLTTGAHIVHLAIPVSDVQIERKLRRSRDWVLATVQSLVTRARGEGVDVSAGLEDASRADESFLARVAEAAQAAGARRVRYADTLGLLDPFSTLTRVARLRRHVDIEIEMHAHDDLGLATANTLAALAAGATHASTSVNGLGERAGNAALEEVVMALRHIYATDVHIDTRQLPRISALVARASGRPVSPNKSVVGDWVFAHEAGIHVDGLIKDRLNYQSFDPAEVGREHRVVLGKHSGSRSVVAAYARLGIVLDDDEAEGLLARIREHVVRTKREPGVDELRRLYLQAIRPVGADRVA